MNKYCGQHLIIANEIQPTEPDSLPSPPRSHSPTYDADKEPPKGEPVAEALIQNEQSFHHLKILKSSIEQPEQIPYEPIRPTKQKNKNRRVYSQVSGFTEFSAVMLIIALFQFIRQKINKIYTLQNFGANGRLGGSYAWHWHFCSTFFFKHTCRVRSDNINGQSGFPI